MNALLLAVLGCLASGPIQDPQPFFERGTLLQHASGGAYAIPKLLVTVKGTLIVALQDREGGDWAAPILPTVLRSTDGGSSWSELVVLHCEEGSYVKPTALVQDRETGRITVFLIRAPLATPEGKRIDEIWFYENIQETRRLGRAWFTVTSDDEGVTWSKPRDITSQLIVEKHWQEWSPVHVGIQLAEGEHAGRLVVPVRVYCPEEDPSEHDLRFQMNGVLYSDDGGTTWVPGARSTAYHGECSIVELPGGAIYVNHRRSRGRGKLRDYSISNDGGVTFAEHGEHPDLPDQLCHAGLTRIAGTDGKPWLVLSNVPGPKRRGLVISISRDLGRTWSRARELEPGPAAYSTLGARGGKLICVYETGPQSSRKDLAVARFDLGWLLMDQREDSR